MHRRHVTFLLVLVVLVAVPVFGAHRWSTYHWAKTSAQIAPPVVMNISAPWTDYAARVMTDWNASGVIESPWSFGAISTKRKCSSTTGKIEVCNLKYGQNGWLGIAGISLSGGHIVKGYTKLNDTYYASSTYNTPAWRRMVFCQEVGHDYGLGHVNENFNDANTGSCMDYTNDPSGTKGTNGTLSNEYPNSHDYQELNTIYNHTDVVTLPFDSMTSDATRPRSIEEFMADAGQWGTPVSFDANGRPDVFYLKTGSDHNGDHESLVHVFWAPIEVDFDRERPADAGDMNQ
jgi:hypothetical protein